jgi:hypothetical protein
MARTSKVDMCATFVNEGAGADLPTGSAEAMPVTDEICQGFPCSAACTSWASSAVRGASASRLTSRVGSA